MHILLFWSLLLATLEPPFTPILQSGAGRTAQSYKQLWRKLRCKVDSEQQQHVCERGTGRQAYPLLPKQQCFHTGLKPLHLQDDRLYTAHEKENQRSDNACCDEECIFIKRREKRRNDDVAQQRL
jgi:hypothetical protein